MVDTKARFIADHLHEHVEQHLDGDREMDNSVLTNVLSIDDVIEEDPDFAMYSFRIGFGGGELYDIVVKPV